MTPAITLTLSHVQVWGTWLRASAGLLRADCLAGRVCGDANRGAALAAVRAACANASAGANGAAQLFSVYVHPPPAFRGYPAGSIFRGREVPNRVKVRWGDYSIVEARPCIGPTGLHDSIDMGESCEWWLAFMLTCRRAFFLTT